MGELIEYCSSCGKLREAVKVLIKYNNGFICDTCVIDENENLLAELEEIEFEERDDELLTVEEEEDPDYVWNPFTGFGDNEKLDYFLNKQKGQTSLEELQVTPEALSIIPRELVCSLKVLPIRREGSTLVVAVCKSTNEKAAEKLNLLTGLNVETVFVDENEIDDAIERFFNT